MKDTERAEQKREEREMRHMDRKVEGVAIDTRILPQEKKHSEEIQEISADSYIEIPEVKRKRKSY